MPRKLDPALVAEKLDVSKFIEALPYHHDFNENQIYEMIRTFYHCCGIKEVSASWLNKLYRYCLKHRPMLTADEFIAILQHICDDQGLQEGAGVVATTIPSQKKPVETLTLLGFAPIVVSKNPTTKRVITVWVRSA